LIREAVPFSLKLRKAFFPHATPCGAPDSGLQGFTEYAYAFVQADTEKMGDAQYDKKKAWNVRAKNLYLRAQGYGLRVWTPGTISSARC